MCVSIGERRIKWADMEGEVKTMRLDRRSLTIIAGILLLFGLLILTGFGYKMSSPGHLLVTFESAVKENDTAQLKKLLISDNKKVKISNSSTKALLDYLRTHHEAFNEVKRDLEKDINRQTLNSEGVLSFSQTGRHFLFFKAYKLKLRAQAIVISGLRKGEVLAMSANQRNVPRKGNSYGPILPGNYTVQEQLTNDLGIFIKKGKLSVWDGQVSIDVDSETWMAHSSAIQKQVIERIDQFNQEVSVWETSEYDPEKLPSATETFRESQSAMKREEFDKLKSKLEKVQSAYLGMFVDPDSLTLTYYGDHWDATVDTVISYKYGYQLKKDKQMQDASYQRGVSYRLIYDRDQKQWLVSGFSDNYITEDMASDWKKKKEIKNPDPVIQTWSANGGTHL